MLLGSKITVVSLCVLALRTDTAASVRNASISVMYSQLCISTSDGSSSRVDASGDDENIPRVLQALRTCAQQDPSPRVRTLAIERIRDMEMLTVDNSLSDFARQRCNDIDISARVSGYRLVQSLMQRGGHAIFTHSATLAKILSRDLPAAGSTMIEILQSNESNGIENLIKQGLADLSYLDSCSGRSPKVHLTLWPQQHTS
eukprot:SAG31_NODE_2875_length_4971_cov_2.727011_3_plen_201_part_00